MEEGTAYGNGFVYNLVLIGFHIQELQLTINGSSPHRAMGLCLIGIRDHLREFTIPNSCPVNLGREIKKWQDSVLRLLGEDKRGLGHYDKEQLFELFDRFLELTREIDKWLGVNVTQAVIE